MNFVIFSVKPFPCNYCPENIDYWNPKNGFHPGTFLKIEHLKSWIFFNLCYLKSWFSYLDRWVIKSSTSSWMTPWRPTFPNPKSFKCLRANLLCSIQSLPFVLIMPWKTGIDIFKQTRLPLFFPLSDPRYLEIIFECLPHHSSLFHQILGQLEVLKFWSWERTGKRNICDIYDCKAQNMFSVKSASLYFESNISKLFVCLKQSLS